MPAELRQQQKFTTRTVSGSHQNKKNQYKRGAHGRTRDIHDKCPSAEILGIGDKATPLPHI